jgi:hypothetical protein
MAQLRHAEREEGKRLALTAKIIRMAVWGDDKFQSMIDVLEGR